MSKIKLCIEDGPVSPAPSNTTAGWQASLVIDPRDCTVWVHATIGGGTLMDAYHGHLQCVPISALAGGESVRGILEQPENMAVLEHIVSFYEGKHWDGRNHIGVWSEDPDNRLYAYLASLEETLDAAATYWDAGDWLAGAWSECRHEVGAIWNTRESNVGWQEDLDTLAAKWVEEGRQADALVDLGAVRRQIDRMVEQLESEGYDGE